MSWTLRRGLRRAFVSVAVLLAVLGCLVAIAVASFISAGDTVMNRWQAAETHSERMLADLVNQETGLRGFALGRASRFLEPYNQYLARQRSDDAGLHALVRGDKTLEVLAGRVDTAAAGWRSAVALPLIETVERGGAPTAVALDAGKKSFDDIRRASARLSDALAERTAQAQAARFRDGIFAAVATGVAIVVVVVSALLVRRGLFRWVLEPIDRLRTQTREVASGSLNRSIVADGPAELVELGADVEAMRGQIAGELHRAEQVQEELRIRSAELARSNEDLQQFAYVASHDLSEPLRKVANFCQLLERQYGPQLDDRARQYIDFAVDGAKRMQVLITDLLALSRVGRTTDAFVEVDLDSRVQRAIDNLAERITEAGARIERVTALPTVRGDRALLTSLFENLIGNAVKYRRPDIAPVVRIAAEHDPEQRLWTISVSDNGIGIEAQYSERIFAVFQRLHLRDQYGGTGIGLALCRRIVEFHAGRIWLADVGSADGSTFRLTFPESGPSAQPRD